MSKIIRTAYTNTGNWQGDRLNCVSANVQYICKHNDFNANLSAIEKETILQKRELNKQNKPMRKINPQIDKNHSYVRV